MIYTVHFHPYANQYAKIEIPDNIIGAPEIRKYIKNHWDKIRFGEPDLDYCSTDFEIYDKDDNEVKGY